VATVTCRRITRETSAWLSAWQFTAAGAILLPAELTAAANGLHVSGAPDLNPSQSCGT
jgi:hypothetical protein